MNVEMTHRVSIKIKSTDNRTRIILKYPETISVLAEIESEKQCQYSQMPDKFETTEIRTTKQNLENSSTVSAI